MLIQFPHRSFSCKTRRSGAKLQIDQHTKKLNWINKFNFIRHRFGWKMLKLVNKKISERIFTFAHKTSAFIKRFPVLDERPAEKNNIINHKEEVWKRNYRKENEVRKQRKDENFYVINYEQRFSAINFISFRSHFSRPARTANTILVGIESSLLINGLLWSTHVGAKLGETKFHPRRKKVRREHGTQKNCYVLNRVESTKAESHRLMFILVHGLSVMIKQLKSRTWLMMN